ncbi:50S ribosomal protein L28, partial [Mycoplasmopsis synoviae]
MSGNTRSHAMNASRRKFNVNLQKVRVDFGSGKRTLRISAKTLKTW